jgi:hypothetical protein
MPAPQSLPSRLIGALFVERGLVSESQIRVALEIQRETGQQLGQVLVERFGVSRKELASVVADQWAKLGGSSGPEDSASWRRLGDIFVERGFVTPEELDEALARQRQTGERLGEALVAQGVISKFELAGALAEQMAVLGDPDTEVAAENGQPEATVHQLHGRDDAEQAPPPTNVIELAAPTDWGAEAVETEPQAVETEPQVVETIEEPVAEEAPAEREALGAVDAHPEPAEEPQPVEAEAEPIEEPQPDEVHVDHVERPQPAEVMLTEFHEALAAEVEYLDEASPEVDPRTACLAFAPTIDGYRLVALELQPEPGETIDIDEVGEYLVLRVGSSPIPGDDRRCAYVEERVTPALAAAVAH